MQSRMELAGLAPDPAEQWQRSLRFVGWGPAERRAAAPSLEALFRRGPELVAGTYDYLRSVPETAAILGWETRVDPAHLEERRRFFTLWLARTLGLDTSDEFAWYLFRAGQAHAGHGPRHIHTPPEYVIGSVGLVLAAFANAMAEARLSGEALGAAMAAWSKYLAAQQQQMLLGYYAARDLRAGEAPIRCALYGKLRELAGRPELVAWGPEGTTVGEVLRRLFNGYPQLRAEALEQAWEEEEDSRRLWIELTPVYRPRRGWRVLLNGREVAYTGGFDTPARADDLIALFPPGR